MNSSVVSLLFLSSSCPPFRADALDTGFDRDAARPAEKVDQLLAPEVDPRLHAEIDRAVRHRLQQFAIRQEDLVDEVDVLDALRDQAVQLVEDDWPRGRLR